ncbi:MAG: archease [archaeon]|nr:archease [archaeon]
MKYEVLDHMADVMIRCTGKDLCECFENMAYAMFDQMVDTKNIEHSVEYNIEVSASNDEEKLYSFLSELLFVMDTESLVFNDFKVTIKNDTVKCRSKGEHLNKRKHRAKSEIKAITYHMLSVDRDIPAVTAIFDV